MNLKKCLAVVLSLTLLLTCAISGLSLNTSAATSVDDAKAALEAAWNALEYPADPQIALNTFYFKAATDNVLSTSWKGTGHDGKTGEIRDYPNLGTFTFESQSNSITEEEAFIISGPDDDEAGTPINYNDSTIVLSVGSKLTFWTKSATAKNISVQIVGAINSTVTSQAISLDGTNEWQKHEIVLNADQYNRLTNQGQYAERCLGRLQFEETAIAGVQISGVVFQKGTGAPKTTTLADAIAAAEAFDTTGIASDLTEFNKALDDAKAAMYADEASAAAYILGEWAKVTNKSELVFGYFHENSTGSFKPVSATNTNLTTQTIQGDNVDVFASTSAGAIINGVASSHKAQSGIVYIGDYSEIYFYYKSENALNRIQNPTISPTLGYGNGATVNKVLTLPACTDFTKVDVKAALLDAIGDISTPANKEVYDKYNGKDGMGWGRLHVEGNADKLQISQILGVKPIVFGTTFSAAFNTDGTAKNLNLAQVINAYASYDFSAYNNTEALETAVDNVLNAQPDYAAFKNVATYANSLQTMDGLMGFAKSTGNTTVYATGNAEFPVTLPVNAKDANGEDIKINACPNYDMSTVYKASITGSGFDKISESGWTDFFKAVPHNDYKTYNSDADVTLAYFIPGSVNGDVKLKVEVRGKTVTDVTTNGKATYQKVVDLTARDEWATITKDQIFVEDMASISEWVVGLYATKDLATDVYLSPAVFAGKKLSFTGDTLNDFADQYNAINADYGNGGTRYIANRNNFETARTAFNKALNVGFDAHEHAVVNYENSHVYTVGDVEYTAYRTFAKYTCPVDNGVADPTQIKVGDKYYPINSRTMFIARNKTENVFTDPLNETAVTAGTAKSVTTTGEALNTCWDIQYNSDGETATVIFSIQLRNVTEANAKAYYQTRAMIEYVDDAKNTVKVYSDAKLCGTIEALHNQIVDTDGPIPWFTQTAQ